MKLQMMIKFQNKFYGDEFMDLKTDYAILAFIQLRILLINILKSISDAGFLGIFMDSYERSSVMLTMWL